MPSLTNWFVIALVAYFALSSVQLFFLFRPSGFPFAAPEKTERGVFLSPFVGSEKFRLTVYLSNVARRWTSFSDRENILFDEDVNVHEPFARVCLLLSSVVFV
jgi:hypothetical protein